MQQIKSIAKVAAVISSVVLVAGFVSYRAGAFDRARETRPSIEDGNLAEESIPNATAVSPELPVYLSTSKSITFAVPPSGSAVPGGSLQAKSPIIMGGSKSLSPVIPPSASSPAPSQQPSTPPR